MRITPMEIREHQLKKRLFGYDIQEVEAFKDLCAEALEEASKKVHRLEEKLKRTCERLSEFEERESILKETITTAQKMVEDLKENARKEAELIIIEAKNQAEEIVRHARERCERIQDDIVQLRKQKAELVSSIKSILDYHTGILSMNEESDEDKGSDKLTLFPQR